LSRGCTTPTPLGTDETKQVVVIFIVVGAIGMMHSTVEDQ
jgi:hypothetical protein